MRPSSLERATLPVSATAKRAQETPKGASSGAARGGGPEVLGEGLAEGGPGKPLGEALGEGFGLFPGKPRGLGPVFLKAPQEEVHGVLVKGVWGCSGRRALGRSFRARCTRARILVLASTLHLLPELVEGLGAWLQGAPALRPGLKEGEEVLGEGKAP